MANILTNGDFEALTGWQAAAGCAVVTQNADVRPGSAGSNSANVEKGATGGNAYCYRQIGTPIGSWLRCDGWLKNIVRTAGTPQVFLYDTTTKVFYSGTETEWTQKAGVIRSAAIAPTIYCSVGTTAGDSTRHDDVTIEILDLASLFSGLVSSHADFEASLDVTVAGNFHGGLVLCLDNAGTPANFLIAYYDRRDGKVYLDKCVAGTYTNVINAAATYAAGAPLKVIKIGTAVSLYYNGVLIGSGTVSDAGIVDNVLHGKFSTGASAAEVTLGNITIVADARTTYPGGDPAGGTLTAKAYYQGVELASTGGYVNGVGVALANVTYVDNILEADDLAVDLVTASIDRWSIYDHNGREIIRFTLFPAVTVSVPTAYVFPWPTGGVEYQVGGNTASRFYLEMEMH